MKRPADLLRFRRSDGSGQPRPEVDTADRRRCPGGPVNFIGGAVWAAAGVDAAVQEIEQINGQADAWVQVDREPDDAAAAHQIKARHAQAGRDLERMLAARDAGDIALAKAIHDRPVHPAYATLQYKTRAPGRGRPADHRGAARNRHRRPARRG